MRTVGVPISCVSTAPFYNPRRVAHHLPPGDRAMTGPGDSAVAPKRRLGLVMCVALVVGNMIGTGIFQLPRNLAPLGWNSVVGWLATIGGTLCLAVVLLRLARGRADGCGPYVYPAAAFGPGTGFVVAW